MRVKNENSNAIYQKVKPKDCTICFGIPVMVEEMDHSFDDPKRDFCQRFITSEGWHFDRNRYIREVISPYERVAPYFCKLGLKQKYDCGLDEYLKVIYDSSVKVVILFSHWTADKIEFKNGMVHYSEISAVVPQKYQGILDLCVCHPVNWVRSLYDTHPGVVKRALTTAATPAYWLHFYKWLMKILHDGELTYFEAFQETRKYIYDLQKKSLPT